MAIASPFPGMDPYLEARWSNVHVLMMGAITAALNQTLPEGLEARPEEEIRIETLAGERLQGFRPDIAVIETQSAADGTSPSATGVAATALRVSYLRTPVPRRSVHIVDLNSHDRIVTAIEVLSPWNKRAGRLNRAYRQKLRAYERGHTNWVEIDLLRSSRDRLFVTWDDLDPARRAAYMVVAFDAEDTDLQVYPLILRERLPTIAVPLRQQDQSVTLDLQAVFERVYFEGRFRSVDYDVECAPPLSEQDRQWFDARRKTPSNL